MRSNRLDLFFKPRSLAVIGASNKPGSLGRALAENVISSFKGNVYLINIKGGIILNKPVYKSILDVPESVDLALIITPSHTVADVMDECGRKGVRCVVVLSGGFREIGPEGAERERKLLEIAKKYNMRIIGPNCVGIMNFKIGLDATFTSRHHQARPTIGPVSLITQSGALGSLILDLAAEMGIGFSKYISVGNMVDVDVVELIDYLADDRETGVIGVYLEGVRDGKSFMKVCRRASSIKPVVIFKSGRTESGARAVLSHTGAIAGSNKIFRAALRQSGGIYAETLDMFMSYLNIFSKVSPPNGRRVAVITNAGGMGVAVTDALSEAGLEVPETPIELVKDLKRILPAYNTLVNPIDLSGDSDHQRYDNVLKIVRSADWVDIIVIVSLLQSPAIDGSKLVEIIVKHASEEQEKTIVALISGGLYSRVWAKRLNLLGVPTYEWPHNLALSLKTLIDYYKV